MLSVQIFWRYIFLFASDIICMNTVIQIAFSVVLVLRHTSGSRHFDSDKALRAVVNFS